MHQAQWHGDHEWVQNARVLANKEGTPFKRPLWAPVSMEHLHVLHGALNLSDPFHAAVWVVATTTFFGCRRLGEITIKNATTFNPLHHVTRATTPTFQALTNGSSSASIRIPWTKTTKHDGALIIITSRSDIFCPVAALRNHLSINCNAPPQPHPSLASAMLITHGHICFRTCFSSLSPRSGSRPQWITFLVIASASVEQLNCFWQAYPLRLSQQQEVGHHLRSFFTGAGWKRSYH